MSGIDKYEVRRSKLSRLVINSIHVKSSIGNILQSYHETKRPQVSDLATPPDSAGRLIAFD